MNPSSKTSMYADREAAASYQRLFARLVIAPFAEDLVKEVDLPAQGRVLDVGAGTGAASAFAARAIGSRGRVVAADPSLEMLSLAPKDATLEAVVARTPGLPFRSGVFDAAIACFVLSHVESYDAALADMTRIVRSGGRVGATAWALIANPAGEAWGRVAGRYVSAVTLADAFRQHIPWEEELSDEARLAAAFARAGLSSIVVKRSQHLMRVTTGEFLAMREASIEGRLLARALDATALAKMRQEVAAEFRDLFPGVLEYPRTALVAIGTKAC